MVVNDLTFRGDAKEKHAQLREHVRRAHSCMFELLADIFEAGRSRKIPTVDTRIEAALEAANFI